MCCAAVGVDEGNIAVESVEVLTRMNHAPLYRRCSVAPSQGGYRQIPKEAYIVGVVADTDDAPAGADAGDGDGGYWHPWSGERFLG